MNPPNKNRPPLPEIVEAAGIAQLLAEVARHKTPFPKARLVPLVEPPAPPATPHAEADLLPHSTPPPLPGALQPTSDEYDERRVLAVGQFLGKANWRNEPPREVPSYIDVDDTLIRPQPAIPGVAEEPERVPVGVLTVAEFLALVNWRNRDEDTKQLPIIPPERPLGYEWTVEAVMSSFFGD